MRVPMGTYVTYEELNNGGPCSIESFREFLSKYQRSKVLFVCALFNCLTRKWYGAIDKKAHDELASVAFKPTLLEYMNSDPDRPRRIIFHRLQVLFVAKEAAIHCSEEGIDPLNTPHWGDLGKAFLMANDLIHTEIEERNPTLRKLTQYISVAEYSFPSDLRSILARCNLTLTRFIPSSSDLNIPDLFERASGLGLNDFRIMCLGVLTQYFELDGEAYKKNKSEFLVGPDFFRSTTIPQEKVDLFLHEMSFDPNELKAMFEKRNGGRLDFTPFRNRPLIRIDRSYFPIDIQFLVEKLEAGPFWRIHSFVEQKRKLALHSAWGKGFESYTNWLFSHSTDGNINAFHKTPTYQGSKNQVTDNIIVCGNEAIFLECKIAMMPVEAKYSGNSTMLAEELQKKFVESGERVQGLKQLAIAINNVFSKESPRSVNGLDLSKIHTVYPVILTRDSIGGSVGLSKYLREDFKAHVKHKSLSVVVTPLFCLSIGQLEEISDVLGKTSLAELLHGWWRTDRTLALNFLMASDTQVRNQSRTLNSALIEAIDELFDETIKYFPDVKGANGIDLDAT